MLGNSPRALQRPQVLEPPLDPGAVRSARRLISAFPAAERLSEHEDPILRV